MKRAFQFAQRLFDTPGVSTKAPSYITNQPPAPPPTPTEEPTNVAPIVEEKPIEQPKVEETKPVVDNKTTTKLPKI